MERCELWVKIGRWYGEHLERPDYGIQSLEKALELNPESVSALRELANFHRRAESWPELADALGRIVPLEQEPHDQAETLLDLAQVLEERLGDVDGAVEAYRRVLEIDSESRHRPGCAHPAARGPGGLARSGAGALASGGDLRGDRRGDQPQEAHRLRAGGQPRRQRGGHRDLQGHPGAGAHGLRRPDRRWSACTSGATQVDDYLETLEAQLDATADVEQQVVHLREDGAGAGDHGRRSRARHRGAREDRDARSEAGITTYRQLEELYGGLEKWTELVETYRSHIEASGDVQIKIQLLAAMGEVYEKKVEDVDRAIDTYQEILELDPHNYYAADTLSQLQERIEDWPSAIDTLSRMAELTGDMNAAHRSAHPHGAGAPPEARQPR